MGTLEGDMGSLMVLWLQLPAKAGIMGYAEHAVHRGPQTGKDSDSDPCFYSFSSKRFVYFQYRGQVSSFFFLMSPRENPSKILSGDMHMADLPILTVIFHQGKNWLRCKLKGNLKEEREERHDPGSTGG